MGWREVTRKEYDCDNCEKTMGDPEFEIAHNYPLDADMGDYDSMEDEGWAKVTVDGKDLVFCPRCWHYCEGDGYSPVEGKADDCADADCIEARG